MSANKKHHQNHPLITLPYEKSLFKNEQDLLDHLNVIKQAMEISKEDKELAREIYKKAIQSVVDKK